MSHPHSLRGGITTAVIAALVAVGAGTSCASAPDVNRLTTVIQPDFDTYKASVDTYLSRRCGTLDCHGQTGRGYRMYGRNGIRLTTGVDDAGLVSGQQATTDGEILANFQAIIRCSPTPTMSRASQPKALALWRPGLGRAATRPSANRASTEPS